VTNAAIRQRARDAALTAGRLTGPVVPGRPKRGVGTLDRVARWTKGFGVVYSAPGFGRRRGISCRT